MSTSEQRRVERRAAERRGEVAGPVERRVADRRTEALTAAELEARLRQLGVRDDRRRGQRRR